jgi:RNA polymerase sigma factor (sigma-70 family)
VTLDPTQDSSDNLDQNDKDYDLLKRVLSGQKEAWKEFISRFKILVNTTCHSYVGPTHADQLFKSYFEKKMDDSDNTLKNFKKGTSKLENYLLVDCHDFCINQVFIKFIHLPESGGAILKNLEEIYRKRLIKTIRLTLNKYKIYDTDVDPEDVWGDLRLKLMENDYKILKSFEGRGNFISWFEVIAQRLTVDNIRGLKDTVPILENHDNDEESSESGVVLTSNELNPEEKIIKAEDDYEEKKKFQLRKKSLKESAPKLSADSQFLLENKFVRKMKPEESANMLRTDRNFVYRQAGKNIEKLKKLMIPKTGKDSSLKL